MDNYQQALSKTLIQLEDCKEILIDCLFEIAINGELKVWAESVEVGEDFYFSKVLYESLEDVNIKHLLSLISHLEMRFPRLP